jgi:hypothetical protein
MVKPGSEFKDSKIISPEGLRYGYSEFEKAIITAANIYSKKKIDAPSLIKDALIYKCLPDLHHSAPSGSGVGGGLDNNHLAYELNKYRYSML